MILALACWWVCPVRVVGGEIKLATDAPKPLPPEESRKLFRLAEGFHIELAASEPLLADPVTIAFDARGRMFVCEIHGYNLEGYLDVLQENKTGVLDKKVRRIPANPEARRRAEEEQYGTVKVLEDTDGDGRMDRASDWADRLPACYGVVPARDGAIVLCAPDILYLADRDGDGKAEVRETLFTGFGLYDMWSRINNPRWGLDNWIYAVNGIGSGGTITGPRLPGKVKLGAVCFRFKPDGSALEPVSGKTSGFGQAINDWGDRFLVTNQQHVLYIAPLPYRYLARNPYYAAPNPVINISSYGHPARVYPISQPDPWRLARSKDPEWVKFYGVAEATANGYFTAASGQTIYRAAEFPPEFRGNHFSVDNAQNLIHRCVLVPDGASLVAKRPREDEQTEFLLSTEQWFRPVNLVVGPDSALYVVDMYRDIIEDYSAIPRFLQQLYVKSIIAGADRGRIWRIAAEDGSKPQKVDLTAASADELVRHLSRSNAWWRQTAQRLLVERGDKSVVKLLESLVRQDGMLRGGDAATRRRGENPGSSTVGAHPPVSPSPRLPVSVSPQARLHALYTLDGLDSLDPALVEHALSDPHFALRMHALCLSERWLDAGNGMVRGTHHSEPSAGVLHTPYSATLLEQIVRMADDPHPRVRLQLAFTLGECRDKAAVDVLFKLAVAAGDDAWMQAAILSSAARSADQLLGRIFRSKAALGQTRSLLRPLASTIGARRDEEQISRLLKEVADAGSDRPAELGVTALEGLLEGLKQGKAAPLNDVAGRKALARLLVDASPKVRELTLLISGQVKLGDMPEMKEAITSATETALDEDKTVEDRQAAIRLLAAAPFEELAEAAEELLAPRQPLSIQLAATELLATVDRPDAASILLFNWRSYSPSVQSAALDTIFSRQKYLPRLLDALEDETLPPGSLDASRQLRLTGSRDTEISRRAKKLFTGGGGDKAVSERLGRYQAALAQARDAGRGKKVYEEQCAKCHRLKDQGYQVGPDLSTVSSRPDETLVSDIIDPNNQIAAGYQNYTVITEDGRIFTGVLTAETATSVTLRKEQGVDQTILRARIDEMAASPLSMMPEDVYTLVTPQNVADLIAFLRKSLGPASASVTLFDDDRSFVRLLDQGKGTARISTEQPFSGAACLSVTPPQRWSLRIPGWSYKIAEKPGPGEFRYLRFAWRSLGGQGVMIELAAEGKWPPAEKPLRRYYSGKNTTGWAAVEVSPDVPEKWIVVERDLWEDFGSFQLTGIAPTAMGGRAFFDRIELRQSPSQ